MVMRPDNMGWTRAFLGLTAYEKLDEILARFEKASKEGIPEQKALVQELFQDADWEISRILKGMHKSDDFYLQHTAQVKLNRWSSSRVAVVGDAGYAPSPFSGMGTSIAFIGAYVLAGEISKQPNSIPAALESYERILHPYFKSIQKLPPVIPWIVNPQSALGVRVFETVAWGVGVLSATGVATLFSKLAAYLPSREDSFKLPDYEAFGQ
jgi:2-polyprenyl-6-methoxyphenol hydroxylase-like FAD-dependent oxidoreductase